MLQCHLDRDPLIVWDEEGSGDRLVVVLTSEEEESSCVTTHKIQHEAAIELHQVAVSLGIRGVSCCARCLIELNRHRDGVGVLVLEKVRIIQVVACQFVVVIEP